MQVSQLLAERPGPLLSTEPEATVHDFAKTQDRLTRLMRTRGEIVGVISERDIISGLAKVDVDAISAKSEA